MQTIILMGSIIMGTVVALGAVGMSGKKAYAKQNHSSFHRANWVAGIIVAMLLTAAGTALACGQHINSAEVIAGSVWVIIAVLVNAVALFCDRAMASDNRKPNHSYIWYSSMAVCTVLITFKTAIALTTLPAYKTPFVEGTLRSIIWLSTIFLVGTTVCLGKIGYAKAHNTRPRVANWVTVTAIAMVLMSMFSALVAAGQSHSTPIVFGIIMLITEVLLGAICYMRDTIKGKNVVWLCFTAAPVVVTIALTAIAYVH